MILPARDALSGETGTEMKADPPLGMTTRNERKEAVDGGGRGGMGGQVE